MNELKHEQARCYLHVGKENLSGGERESLNCHLSECSVCRSYASELGTLQSTLSQVMHAQWDPLAPTRVPDKQIHGRIWRKIVQKQVLNLTSSLASGAVLLGFIVVIAWFFRPAPPVPVNVGSAGVPTRVNQTFGNMITLLNYGLNQDHFTAGDTAVLTLSWQARVVPQIAYAVSIRLQDVNDRLLAQSDGLPVNGTRPTTSWKTDEVIEDRREINLPKTLPPGQYKLVVAVYDPKTGTRLNTSDGKNAIDLTTVNIQSRVNLTFGNTITLLDFRLGQALLAAGETASITLLWQVHAVPQTSYAVFIHLQDENGRILAQSDALPLNGTRPTTNWKPDEVIEDPREIRLPGTLAPGPYKVIVGLYDPNTGARLNTNDGKDAIALTTVDVQ